MPALPCQQSGVGGRVHAAHLAHALHHEPEQPAQQGQAAAGHDHLEVGVARKDQGHVEVVGDDPQAVVVEQGLGHLLGGGADVEDEFGAEVGGRGRGLKA